MKHPRLDPARFFGEVGGEPVALFRLRHASGMEVAVCNLGAKVLQILVPDRDGNLGDVALGYDSLAALQAAWPHPLLPRLQQALDDFDFDAALQALAQLRQAAAQTR